MSANSDINISTIYSTFDIEPNSVWDNVINYRFPKDEVLDEYIKDSVVRLRVNKLKVEKQSLKTRISECENCDKKYEYLAKMRDIIIKIYLDAVYWLCCTILFRGKS